jgi:hypothetical protein
LNPYVFVVGCQRSGTTLLQQMLDAHPDLAVTCDSDFIVRPLDEAGAETDVKLEPELVELAIGYRSPTGRAGFHRLELAEDTARRLADRASTYAEFVRLVFDEVAARCGKPKAGDKTPDYARSIPLLHGLFPWARFVHILRDGRDVALSLRQWATNAGPRRLARTRVWQEEPIAACALWWAGMVTSAEDDGGHLGPGQYMTVRYEHLVANPEAVLTRVTAFLGLPFAAEMLRYYEGRPQQRRPGGPSNLPPTMGLRDWRTQMERGDLEVFESLAGGLLDQLGYERGVAAIPAEVDVKAQRWRRRWTKKFGRAARSASRAAGTASGTNPCVFLVGCQRSGTTLVTRMLDRHPDLAVTLDGEFIPRVLKEAGANTDVKLEPELAEMAISYRSRSGRAGFQKLDVDEDAARGLAARASTFAEFVSLVYDEVAARRGKSKAGDKTPDYARCIPLLHELFPWARFVHVVRDGRDVALSMREWAVEGRPRGPARTKVWQEEPAAACALWWAGMVTKAGHDGARLGPGQYLMFRYEDLVADQDAALRRVLPFLGLPFAPEVLEIQARPGRRDWRTQMERRDVEIFEVIAGDLLRSLGYERTVATFDPELEERARRWRSRWPKQYAPVDGELPSPQETV